MSIRFSHKPYIIGFLSLFLLAAAIATSLLFPGITSAAGDSLTEFVLQSPTDNVLRVAITTNDIIYNPQDKTIYATRPSSVGENGNSITRINPLTGEIGASVYVGSEPNKIALSDNGQTIYVALDGAYAIRRYETTTQTPGLQFPIGRESPASFPLGSPYNASDLAVAPGNPNLLAVARYSPGYSPGGAGVAIFSNGSQLPQIGPGHNDNANFLAFSDSANTLYGGGYYTVFRTMTINESGVTDITPVGTSFAVKNLKFENNLVFTSTGQIINPQTHTLLGTCFGVNTTAFVPDTATDRVFYAAKDPSSSSITIKAFDINTFIQIGSLTIPNTGSGEPTTLIRYGTNGMAMRTWDNQIYLIQTALIPTNNPLPVPSGTPTITPTPTPTVYSKFVRLVALPNSDLIYSRTEQKFYASVPSRVGAPRGNSITRIEPSTGAVENSVIVGAEPGRLALSDDDQTLYVGINGANAVRKFDIQTQTPGLQFPLGSGINGPKIAYDMDVMPDNPNAVAIGYGSSSYYYDGVDIYDEGVKRAQKANISGSVEFASPTLLYVGENLLYKYAVNQNGLSQVGNLVALNYGEAEFVNGLSYGSSGKVVDPTTGTFKGTFTGLGYPSVLTVDAENNRVFFLTYGDGLGGNGWSIRAYRLDNFLLAGSIKLSEVTLDNSVRRIFRWGQNGLALTDSFSGKIYFVQTDLVSTSGAIPIGLQLGAQSYNSIESGGNMPVTVSRSGTLIGTTSVDYSTQDGTATAGTDYTATSGTITFAPGESSKIINIPIINDNVYEGTESFNFVLSNASGGTVEILSPSAAVLTINDNDNQPNVSAQNISVSEPPIVGTSTALFTVQLSNPTTQTATVNYATANGTATAGSDYVATSGTLTFAPLETTKTIAVQILADNNFTEPNETFRINFTNPNNAFINSFQVTATIINYNPQTARHVRFDFDGDGKSDISVFRPENGIWYLLNSQTGFGGIQFGSSEDKLIPADYDGDGKTDVAVYRNDSWYIQRSALGFTNVQFGQTGDIPVPADYDGDGRTDIAVYRPSTGTWFLQRSTLGFTGIQFGIDSDVPMAGDFDGDGKADLALFRPSNGIWYIFGSTQGFYGVQFGATGDKLVPADYDGDGKIDVAIFRPSNATWYINRSQLGSTVIQFGISTDIPVPADYDGDGKADVAVYRNDTWFIQRSTAGFMGVQFGGAGDQPVPNAFVR